jgi:hypothetical protein
LRRRGMSTEQGSFLDAKSLTHTEHTPVTGDHTAHNENNTGSSGKGTASRDGLFQTSAG